MQDQEFETKTILEVQKKEPEEKTITIRKGNKITGILLEKDKVTSSSRTLVEIKEKNLPMKGNKQILNTALRNDNQQT